MLLRRASVSRIIAAGGAAGLCLRGLGALLLVSPSIAAVAAAATVAVAAAVAFVAAGGASMGCMDS